MDWPANLREVSGGWFAVRAGVLNPRPVGTVRRIEIHQ
jgi:hypothetical protein